MSPNATLERGYAIVTRTGGTIVRDPVELASGDVLGVRVAKGDFKATVADKQDRQN